MLFGIQTSHGQACHRRGGEKQVEANVISLSTQASAKAPGGFLMFSPDHDGKYWKMPQKDAVLH